VLTAATILTQLHCVCFVSANMTAATAVTACLLVCFLDWSRFRLSENLNKHFAWKHYRRWIIMSLT